ncbi:hypothetical protein PCASD_23395 [Puccinia coronata f. sp. avenae]|uniref:Uncharacterized protein n=1 Tax=Puccinia coronata f. sp. avenae TaxID=200324 RepID=A0A2N5SFM2_9BASI|nr:hypothetical protein PCASD_23736 [Puccinia coronata f. sp. avenae]PLW13665.1 hypothetical protein PCASD_23395 [Puccinia coronata f. sp. avenae]
MQGQCFQRLELSALTVWLVSAAVSNPKKDACTVGIDRSNTAGRAVLEQPCLTGDQTGTVGLKPVPAGRTGLSDRFPAGTGHHQPGTDRANPFDRPARASLEPCLSDHRSNMAVRALLDQPCSTGQC